jgi:hypothetical protein
MGGVLTPHLFSYSCSLRGGSNCFSIGIIYFLPTASFDYLRYGLPEVILLEYYNNMPEPIIHIARDGVKIDMQQLGEIIRLFDAGTFKPTDHYWMSGMAEWGSLKDLIAKSRTPPPLPQDNAPKPAWMTPPKHKASIYGEEPATDKQKEFLLCFGVTLPVYLTKYDASRWLDLLLENEEARAHRSEIELTNIWAQKEKYEQEGKYEHGFKTFSGNYRSEYNAYKESGDTEDAKGVMKYRIDTWHELIEFSMDSDVDHIVSQYVAFETHIDVLGLLYEHAKLFKVCPTKKQIKDMLKQLDDQSPTWDDDTPELLLRRLLEEQTKA